MCAGAGARGSRRVCAARLSLHPRFPPPAARRNSRRLAQAAGQVAFGGCGQRITNTAFQTQLVNESTQNSCCYNGRGKSGGVQALAFCTGCIEYRALPDRSVLSNIGLGETA